MEREEGGEGIKGGRENWRGGNEKKKEREGVWRRETEGYSQTDAASRSRVDEKQLKEDA